MTISRSRRFYELLKLENRPEEETVAELDIILAGASSDDEAALSAANAAASATAAATSATASATSATSSANSAVASAASASAASTSETNSAVSETEAADSATEAATSATSAATSATAATGSKNQAATSATNAANSETGAASSQTAAASSATSASSSATSASTSASASSTSATNAASSASSAASSASSASTSATNAATSANEAAMSEVSANSSASAASTSASSAATSAALATTEADRAEAVLSNTRTLESFGALGDTVTTDRLIYISGTDDSTSIQSALDWCKANPARKLLGAGDKIYTIRSTLSGTGHFNLDMQGGLILVDANVQALDWKATVEVESEALTSDYVKGSTSLDITNIGQFTIRNDKVCKIVSDAVDPSDRDEGSSSSQYRVSEFFVTSDISDAHEVFLTKPLKFTTGISPTSTSGDEARVDSYTTALNARVVMVDNDERFILRNARFISEPLQGTWTNKTMTISGFVRPLIENIDILHGYNIGIKLSGTYQATLRNIFVEQLKDDISSSNFGYGIGDAGYGTTVENLHIKNVRHGYTSAVSTLAANETNAYSILQSGRTENGSVRGGTAISSSSAPWDTHQSSDNVVFETNTCDTDTTAYGMRGRNITVISPRILRCNVGFYCFNEYASGSTDDDFWTAGKEPEDVTSGHIISPLILDCNETPIYGSYSFLRLSGTGQVRTKDHTMLLNQGGSLTVSGRHEFTSYGGTVSHSNTGCITVTETNSAMTSAFTNAKTTIDGTVVIDAREATTSGVVGVSLGDNCELVITGKLKLMLPSSSTFATLGTGASIKTEKGGVIEVSVEGANDSTLFDPDDMAGCDVIATDGTAYWYDSSDNRGLVETYKDTDSDTTLVGAATESSSFTPLGQKSWNHLVNEKGTGHMKLELYGTKSGTNDSTSINIRSNSSNYVGKLQMPTFARWFKLTLEVNVHSSGDQVFSGHLICQDNDEDEATSSERVRLLLKTETQLPSSDSHVPFILSITGDGGTFDDITILSYRVLSDFGGHY